MADDTLTSSSNNVALTGGSGDTLFIINHWNVSIIDASGIDTIQTSLSAFTLPTIGYPPTNGIEHLTYTGTSNFTGTGNELANSISGGNGNDTLSGGPTNGWFSLAGDTLTGGEGDDTYLVDYNDIIIESSDGGTDTIISQTSYTLPENVENLTVKPDRSGSGFLKGNSLNNVLKSEAQFYYTWENITLDGGQGVDTLIGGAAREVYMIDHVNDVIIEPIGSYDTVHASLDTYTLAENVEVLYFTGIGPFAGTGNALDNLIYGGDDNDTLDGGGGRDQLFGGKGNDSYRLDIDDYASEAPDEGFDIVEYTGQSDNSHITFDSDVEIVRFVGTGNIEISVAFPFDPTLSNNLIITSEGNDTLDGGSGRDTLIGGTGNDLYTVDDTGDAVVEEINGGIDAVTSSASYYELAAGVENLTLTSWYDYKLDESMELNPGALGNNLANNIRGNADKNTINGIAGSDTINGGSGDDNLFGGADDDVLAGEGGNDNLDGGFGYDVADFSGGRQDYTITRNADGTVIVRDVWTNDGDEGSDLVSGVEAFHFRDGFVTYDSLFPITQPPTPQPPTPEQPVIAPTTSGSDTILGSGVAEKLYGGGGNDQVSGGDGDDWVYGGSGNDLVSGGIGNDRIYGDAGKDRLTGDAGKDSFVFNSKPSKTANIDKIIDFNVKDDSIYLENAIFKSLGKAGSSTKPALMKSSFFYSGAKAHDKDDHIIHNRKTGAIFYDADGTGSSQQVQIAIVEKGLVLTYKDFYII